MTDGAGSDELDDVENKMEVTRDRTFSRHAADVGLVIDLGRDVEFAFLQFGPCVSARIAQTDEDGDPSEAYQFAPGTTEVTRVRMAGASAIQLALLTIDKLLESGKLNGPKLQEAIDAMFANHVSESDE